MVFVRNDCQFFKSALHLIDVDRRYCLLSAFLPQVNMQLNTLEIYGHIYITWSLSDIYVPKDAREGPNHKKDQMKYSITKLP